MRYCVAAIEDGKVRLEGEYDDKRIISIDKLPPDIREGDIVDCDGNEIVINAAATAERRAQIYDKYKRLFKK